MQSWQQINIPSRIDAIHSVRERVSNLLESGQWSREARLEVMLILDELMANAILHGNQGDEQRKVQVRFMLDGPLLRMEIEDEGQGPTEKRVANREHPPADSLSGRGIILVRHLTDNLQYEPGRGLVRFEKTDHSTAPV